MNSVYKKAENLLCSSACPCALRGEVNDGSGARLLWRDLKVVLDAKGPTTVRKCPTFSKDVFSNEMDKQTQFTELLSNIEEEHQCSGICQGVDETGFERYTFSNINDGDPLKSCREPLDALISDNIAHFG